MRIGTRRQYTQIEWSRKANANKKLGASVQSYVASLEEGSHCAFKKVACTLPLQVLQCVHACGVQ